MYNFLITCNLEMPRAERRSFEGVRTFYHLNLLLSSVFHENLKNSQDLVISQDGMCPVTLAN